MNKIIEEIKSNLKKLKNRLSNQIVEKTIKQHFRNIEFDYDEFKNSVTAYINNIGILEETVNDNLLNEINQNLKQFLQNTEDNNKITLYHVKILDSINYLIENKPNVNENNTLLERLKDFKKNNVSKEEFSKRYDKLVQLLNSQDMDCNLILETYGDQVPFKVYKNNNNSIVILAGQEIAPMSISKDRLLKVAYKEKDYTYPSYEPVIIEKIFDNSIFDFLNNSAKIENDLDFTHMPEGRIQKLEDERLKTIGQFKELEDKVEKREKEFKQLSDLLEKSSKLEKNYKSAEASILKEIKLQKSYKFWESQFKSYRIKYFIYGIISILLASYLLYFVYNYLLSNPLVIQNVLDINAIEVQKQEIKLAIDKVNIQVFEVWKYGFLFLLTTMGIWLIRILIKITLSNYHLSIDSKERVIMIRTYLALIKEGKGFEEEDKKVILDNIFRPTNFGIIKDESSVTIADLVSSLKTK